MSTDTQTVTPEDVMQYLQEAKQVPLDLDPEDLGILEEAKQKSGKTPSEPVEVPVPEALANSSGNTTGWLAKGLMPEELAKIEVTDHEKNLYLKSALNETPVRFPVRIPALPSEFVVRSLSQFEQAVIMLTINKDIEQKTILADGEYLSFMQAYMLYLMLESIDSTPYKHKFVIDDDSDLETNAVALRQHHQKSMRSLHPQTQSVLVGALKVFWAKWKLCTDGILNENFWMPRDDA